MRSWRGLAIAGLATMTLSVGLWLGITGLDNGPEPGPRTAHGVASEAAARLDSPESVSPDDASMAAITYPMPGGPFRDQAKAPCRPKRGEVEINGGCWVALEKRPPCFETQAEYQGKCYLPVSAASRKAQSIIP